MLAGMGAWGAGIFDDDDAADIRADFPHYLADAQEIARATDAAAADYGASLEQPARTTAFWLGLALIQWRKGWIDPRVRELALAIIDEGLDLQKWDGSNAAARARALAAARNQLTAPPPPPRPFPRPWPT
jgi:hypothetical protein